jgi:hypothetical protein
VMLTNRIHIHGEQRQSAFTDFCRQLHTLIHRRWVR